MLVDAPGHVDFSAEAERTIAALDLALVVVGAGDGVQGHTETLWDLLERHGTPAIVFVSKCDLENPGRAVLMKELQARLSPACIDLAALLAGDPAATEDAAATDETALDEYLDCSALSPATVARLVRARRIHPVLFGAALKEEGVDELLGALALLAEERICPRSLPRAFGA